ncbi:MAG: hypothetical protein ACK4N5_18025, partial [Myxococcales bacterium]
MPTTPTRRRAPRPPAPRNELLPGTDSPFAPPEQFHRPLDIERLLTGLGGAGDQGVEQAMPEVAVKADHHVLLDRQFPEELQVLERPGDAP